MLPMPCLLLLLLRRLLLTHVEPACHLTREHKRDHSLPSCRGCFQRLIWHCGECCCCVVAKVLKVLFTWGPNLRPIPLH